MTSAQLRPWPSGGSLDLASRGLCSLPRRLSRVVQAWWGRVLAASRAACRLSGRTGVPGVSGTSTAGLSSSWGASASLHSPCCCKTPISGRPRSYAAGSAPSPFLLPPFHRGGNRGPESGWLELAVASWCRRDIQTLRDLQMLGLSLQLLGELFRKEKHFRLSERQRIKLSKENKGSSNSTSGSIPESRVSETCLHTRVHGSFTHNSQKVEAAQASID